MGDPVEIRERVRPSKLSTLLKIARLYADEQSTCLRKQVCYLAVTADFEQIVSVGINGGARGGPNFCDRPMESGNCGCRHAEDNCLAKLRTREEVFLVGTHSPCTMCAKGITVVNTVKGVFCGEAFRDLRGIEILATAGVPIEVLT